MSDPTAALDGLEGELRRYFAVTTSTELPRRVAAMSARTLDGGRRHVRGGRGLAGAAGLLAAAGLAALIATHGSHSASSTANSDQRGTAASPEGGFGATAVVYPAVDSAALAASGVRLLPPDGHGQAAISPGEAQATAVAAAGASAEAPGPAVLAYVELGGHAGPGTCLCWLVDVPVRGGVPGFSSGSSPLRTELVLVDATSGRVDAALTGNGIP